MFDKKSNPLRPEAIASGKPPDLQSCFRATGLPHTVTVSPTLAARCGWVDPSPPSVDRYEVAWLVRLALNGHWPHRQRKTEHGQVLLLDFPVLVSGQEVLNLQLGIVVGQDQKLHLVDPNELDQAAPKRAFVLAAEDDPEIARLVCALLEHDGFTVTHAPNGLEAWKLVQSQPFDIAVLDIDMPGLTGSEVCKRIKATPSLAQLPVVLCSGRMDLSEVAKQAGADDFVEKPTGLLQLATLVTTHSHSVRHCAGLRIDSCSDRRRPLGTAHPNQRQGVGLRGSGRLEGSGGIFWRCASAWMPASQTYWRSSANGSASRASTPED